MKQKPSQSRYQAFIASDAWRKMRQAALERDGFECQTCKEKTQLEVHHRCYSEPLDEQPLSDLITLCHWCHEAITNSIRSRRYDKRSYEPSEIERITPKIKGDKENANQRVKVQIEGGLSTDFTQWANRRSSQQILEAIKAANQQARQDGRGSPRDNEG